MDSWIDPVAFHIGERGIYWYGICVALGFVAAVLFFGWLDKVDGRRKGFGADFSFLCILAGIIGARIAYIASHWDEYAGNPLSMLRIDQGGLVFYGGFILASLSVIAWSLARKESLWRLVDYGVTAVPLAHAFGRVGCFLNGCCYGRESDLPWATYTVGALRHPVQLYETTFNLILFAGLVALFLGKKRDGIVFGTYLIAYGCWRFVAEFFRGDPREELIGSFNVAQGISIALIVSGIVVWLIAPKRQAPTHAG